MSDIVIAPWMNIALVPPFPMKPFFFPAILFVEKVGIIVCNQGRDFNDILNVNILVN